ncbi:hypothetical protein [Anaerococcus sp. AGMB09787]|uniref:hypothetical protein n=1 Tax=Anaerococcus sp. AGMB09787 TaxID=2922869 RepID=UPI001FAEAC63|nr:hypothetical protein [Anaerococcus sp. AGMB09787]
MNVETAAKLIGRDAQSLRYAARYGRIDFITAFKREGSSQWTYWVDEARLKRILESDGAMKLFN